MFLCTIYYYVLAKHIVLDVCIYKYWQISQINLHIHKLTVARSLLGGCTQGRIQGEGCGRQDLRTPLRFQNSSSIALNENLKRTVIFSHILVYLFHVIRLISAQKFILQILQMDRYKFLSLINHDFANRTRCIDLVTFYL